MKVAVHVTTTRDALGALWLPWCVDRSTETELIPVADEPHRIPESRQLRVRDIERKPVQTALGRQIAKGEPSLTKIDSIRAAAENDAALLAIADSTGFICTGDLILMEGCHRTCALHLLNPSGFELQTRLDPGGWPVYSDPRLRRATI